MNNMGSSNSVVRMDMKQLISEDIKLAAISYTFAATTTLMNEYIQGIVKKLYDIIYIKLIMTHHLYQLQTPSITFKLYKSSTGE